MERIAMIIIIGGFVYRFFYMKKGPWWQFVSSLIFIALAAAGGMIANEGSIFNIGIAITVIFAFYKGIAALKGMTDKLTGEESPLMK